MAPLVPALRNNNNNSSNRKQNISSSYSNSDIATARANGIPLGKLDSLCEQGPKQDIRKKTTVNTYRVWLWIGASLAVLCLLERISHLFNRTTKLYDYGACHYVLDKQTTLLTVITINIGYKSDEDMKGIF